MVRIDPTFERIARRLTALELRARTADEDEDLLDPASRTSGDFVHAYSEEGIRHIINEYGLRERLAAQGLADVVVRITQDDPFRHRLTLTLPEPVAGVRDVMDLRLHLCTLGLPGDRDPFDVVVVDWLLMQNPRRLFSAERPRLPGQVFPGTGMGRAVGQLLALLCRRIGRAGLLIVPEHFHLAELYSKVGFRAVEENDEYAFRDILDGTSKLTLAQRAWAVERGFVRDEDGRAVAYHPHARVQAVADALESALSPVGRFFRAATRTRTRLHVDLDGLRRSLRDVPVEGMDPDDIPG